MHEPVPILRRVVATVAMLAAAGGLAGCASLQSSDSFLGVITPYRMEIVQGNVVTREQVARLRPGISRQQVVDALGTPLLTSVFHADRWDYVFTLKRQGVEPQRRSIVVLFEDGVVKSVEVPELPSEEEFVATISNVRPTDVPVLALTDEQRKALPVPVRTEPVVAEPVGPVRDYPPLEAP